MNLAVLYILVLVKVFFVPVEGMMIPEGWITAISLLCQTFNDAAQAALIAPQPSLPIITDNNMLCPRLLLWSPLEQFKSLILNVALCAVCTAAGRRDSRLTPSAKWQDGSTERRQPRKIHDSRGIVLLVSRIYKCKHGHEILGHDPSILSCIPHSLQPFRLWHKTGVMKQLVEDISTFVETGIPISSIESLLFKQYRKDFIRHTSLLCHGDSFEQWGKLFPSATPGWHLIKTCFQIDFAQKGDLYVKHMQQMTINDQDGWLSCDHTFASAGKFGSFIFLLLLIIVLYAALYNIRQYILIIFIFKVNLCKVSNYCKLNCVNCVLYNVVHLSLST